MLIYALNLIEMLRMSIQRLLFARSVTVYRDLKMRLSVCDFVFNLPRPFCQVKLRSYLNGPVLPSNVDIMFIINLVGTTP